MKKIKNQRSRKEGIIMEKDIKNKLRNEKKKNLEKIDELEEKINILRQNTIGSKASVALSISIFPYAIEFLLFAMLGKSVFIPLEVIAPLLIALPAAIGITGETLIYKKHEVKKRLGKFSKAKTEKEKLEEQTKYKIEKEKLKSYNKIIDKTIEKITADENFINSLSDNYKITEKEDNRTKEEIKKDIKSVQQLLEEKHKELDTLVTQKTLKDSFWRVRNSLQRFIELTVETTQSMTMTLVICLPLMFMEIGIPGGFLGFIALAIIGGLAGAGYEIKRQIDETKAFRNINKSLGENALDNFTNNTEKKMKIENNNIERFDLKLEKAINDATAIKLQLVKDKQKLAEIPKMSDSKEVMDSFMKKLENNELNREKKLDEKEAVEIDEKFIEEQLNGYNKLLDSPMIEKATAPQLVKKKKM